MKMAKSRTQKKSNKNPTPADIQNISNSVTDYLKYWTNKELEKLQSNKLQLVCIPIKNGYKIGFYRLTVHPNRVCDVYKHGNEFVHRFDSKVSAVLYTIYTIKNKFYNADEIMYWDKQISKCYTDMTNLRRIINQARINKDYVTVDTRIPRLEIAEADLSVAREKIAQIHRLAKINKVWE
jgi:hypothetical protein